MRFGLITNLKRVGAVEAIETFIDWAKKKKQTLILSHELQEEVSDYKDFCPREDIAGEVDVLVSMGGDGTLLSAARSVGKLDVPLLGINLGFLGFLTQLTPQQLVPALDNILEGKYKLEERMQLEVKVAGQHQPPCPYALNDVVLDNGAVARLLDINLKINGENVVTYASDGLIVSTSTGSTAYNLAVGGPIVHPKVEVMIVAPISSFALTTRPMIVGPSDVLELTVMTEKRDAVLTLDGQVTVKVQNSETIRVSRADFTSKFIMFPENSYYKVLKSKLHWGMSPYST